MCGCCLEICPNYTPESTFSGAASMIHAFKILEQNKEDIHLQKLKENYEKYFFAGCSQSLSCVKICPLGLPLDRIQSRANHHLRETKNEKISFFPYLSFYSCSMCSFSGQHAPKPFLLCDGHLHENHRLWEKQRNRFPPCRKRNTPS